MATDLPPIPERGDDNEDTTYAGVGYALSQWEFAEVELCQLFAALSGLKLNSHEARERYSAQPTFASRLGKLQAAGEANVRVSSDYGLTVAFADLVKSARARAEERNRIAHGIVVELRRRDPPQLSPLVHNNGIPEYCLVPAYYNRRQVDYRTIPSYLYTAADLRMFGAGFRNLYAEACRFRAGIADASPSWPHRPS